MQTVQERFDKRSPNRPTTGCWEWVGVPASPYGRMSVNGSEEYAHRLAYMLHVGPIPPGAELEHVCENRRCVRWTFDPALGSVHIQPATHRENMRRSTMRIGWGAHQRAKTHCSEGHEFTVENTYQHHGKRYCVICRRKRTQEWRARKKVRS